MRSYRAMPGVVLTGVLLLAFMGRAQGQSDNDEYRVKAAFLFHFAQLVDWPADIHNADNRVNVCTLESDPFQGALDGMVEGKPIGALTMHVRHLTQIQDARTCQILFLGKEQKKHLPMILAGLGNAPTMTVGESDNFVQDGGIIHLFLEGNKVRFEVNLQAAAQARLKISSRLLLLAKNVVGERAQR